MHIAPTNHELTNEGLAGIASELGTRIEGLSLRGLYGINDAGLECLAAAPNLRALDLAGTSITSNGLRHLLRLPRLETLGLDSTRVGDQGLSIIAVGRGVLLMILRDSAIS